MRRRWLHRRTSGQATKTGELLGAGRGHQAARVCSHSGGRVPPIGLAGRGQVPDGLDPDGRAV